MDFRPPWDDAEMPVPVKRSPPSSAGGSIDSWETVVRDYATRLWASDARDWIILTLFFLCLVIVLAYISGSFTPSPAPVPAPTMAPTAAAQVGAPTVLGQTNTATSIPPTATPKPTHVVLTISCDSGLSQPCMVARGTGVAHCANTLCGKPLCLLDNDLQIASALHLTDPANTGKDGCTFAGPDDPTKNTLVGTCLHESAGQGAFASFSICTMAVADENVA